MERSREKVFPRKKMFEVPRFFVVVVAAIISILTRPSPREKKVPLAVDVRLLHTARIQDG